VYHALNMSERRPYILVFGIAILLGGAAPVSAEIKVETHQQASKENSPSAISILSKAAGEVQFSLVGKGFLRSATLIPGASLTYELKNPGTYQYRVLAGREQARGILAIENGKKTEVLLSGSFEASKPPVEEASPDHFTYEPKGEGQTLIRNPFGPAFEKLSVDEKIRLVLESPESQKQTPAERAKLLGVLYNEKGVKAAGEKKFAEAEETLRKAFQNLPGEQTVRANLAFAIAASANQQRLGGKLGAGENRLLEALSLLKGGDDAGLETQIHSALAALYVDQAMALAPSETKRRSVLLEKALAQDAGQPAALYHLGEIAYQDYDLAAALEYFEHAYERAPQEDLATLIAQIKTEIAEAGDFETQSQGPFKISFEGSEVRQVARETRKILFDAQREVGRKFDLRPKGTIAVVIYSGGQFKQILGLYNWVGGAYDGKIRLPIADLTDRDLSEGKDQLRQLIYHEYTHALLHNRTAPAKIPVWLHEGLAQNAADQNPDNPILHRAVAQGLAEERLPAPSKLEGDFSSIANSSVAAQVYLESYLFIRYLVEHKGGWPRIRKLVEQIGAQSPIEEAFQAAYHRTLEELEEDWIKELER
jgi:hypothetical protein